MTPTATTDSADPLAHALAYAALGWRVIPVTTEQLNAGDLWPLLDLIFGTDS